MPKLKANYQGEAVVKRSTTRPDKLLVGLPDGDVHLVNTPEEAKELVESWFRRHAQKGLTFNVGEITWDGVTPPS